MIDVQVAIVDTESETYTPLGFGIYDDPDLTVDSPATLLAHGNELRLLLFPWVDGKPQTDVTISGRFKYFPSLTEKLDGVFTRFPESDGEQINFSSLTLTWS